MLEPLFNVSRYINTTITFYLITIIIAFVSQKDFIHTYTTHTNIYTHIQTNTPLTPNSRSVSCADLLLNIQSCFSEKTSAEQREVITFLYQLVEGSAAKSYGLNVARLANISQNIIKQAAQVSHTLETKMANRR